MRRTILAALVIGAALVVPGVPAAAHPADPVPTYPMTAAPGEAHGDWEPVPSGPFDVPAGLVCEFPLHLEPVVDGVYGRTMDIHPDGSTKQVEYVGPLIVRITNTASGESTDVNASGHAIVDHASDGTETWHISGPVLFGFGTAQANNHEPGFFRLVGSYVIEVAATGRTMLSAQGTEENICAALS